ncbi:MAG: SGNH/GDSL hydrolase family protein [Roseburia sp.]|nr:SGNH/GDSL hydrolase family protein [Roseburia sp.]
MIKSTAFKKILAASLCLAAVAGMFLCSCGSSNTGGGDEKNYGTLSVADTYCWLGDYPPTEFVLNYSVVNVNEKPEFVYDNTMIELDAEKYTVKALKEGKTTVKVTTEHLSAEFDVICESVDKDTEDKRFSLTNHANGDLKGWDTRVNNFENEWKQEGRNKSTTLFIGDSFFDCTGFWKTFYTDYEGKDALCWGIGSTTTYSWETICDKLLYKTAPKNVVMHCGTNCVYDIKESADNIVSSLERLFTMMRSAMPSTNFYWLNITKRFNGDTEKESIAEEVNARFTEWAKGRKWLTVIDTRSKLKIDNIQLDGVHPNASGYEKIVNEIANSGIKINDKNT